jgi:hypothetical protein
MKKIAIVAALSLAAGSLAIPAQAQVLTGGLINVTVPVSDVSILNDSLNKNQIAALNNISVPVVVQIPVDVAANVCGTTVALLSAAGSGGACTAKSGSRTLGQAIVRQVLKQKDPLHN